MWQSWVQQNLHEIELWNVWRGEQHFEFKCNAFCKYYESYRNVNILYKQINYSRYFILDERLVVAVATLKNRLITWKRLIIIRSLNGINVKYAVRNSISWLRTGQKREKRKKENIGQCKLIMLTHMNYICYWRT